MSRLQAIRQSPRSQGKNAAGSYKSHAPVDGLKPFKSSSISARWTSAATSSEYINQAKNRSKKKATPLIYFDQTISKQSDLTTELTAHIKACGMRPLPFFDKKVGWVVTKRKDYAKFTSQSHSRFDDLPGFGSLCSSSGRFHLDSPSEIDSPYNHVSSIAPKSKSVGSSRSKMLVDQAKTHASGHSASGQDELALAMRLGIKVVPFSEFRKFVQDKISLKKKRSRDNRSDRQDRSATNTYAISAGNLATKDKNFLELLKDDFIKVEDMSGRYRPAIVEAVRGSRDVLRTRLYVDPESDRCPFLEKSKRSSGSTPKTKKRAPFRRELKGYCNNCGVKFHDGIEKHCATAKHQRFASNIANFSAIDSLVAKNRLKFDDFLSNQLVLTIELSSKAESENEVNEDIEVSVKQVEAKAKKQVELVRQLRNSSPEQPDVIEDDNRSSSPELAKKQPVVIEDDNRSSSPELVLNTDDLVPRKMKRSSQRTTPSELIIDTSGDRLTVNAPYAATAKVHRPKPRKVLKKLESGDVDANDAAKRLKVPVGPRIIRASGLKRRSTRLSTLEETDSNSAMNQRRSIRKTGVGAIQITSTKKKNVNRNSFLSIDCPLSDADEVNVPDSVPESQGPPSDGSLWPGRVEAVLPSSKLYVKYKDGDERIIPMTWATKWRATQKYGKSRTEVTYFSENLKKGDWVGAMFVHGIKVDSERIVNSNQQEQRFKVDDAASSELFIDDPYCSGLSDTSASGAVDILPSEDFLVAHESSDMFETQLSRQIEPPVRRSPRRQTQVQSVSKPPCEPRNIDSRKQRRMSTETPQQISYPKKRRLVGNIPETDDNCIYSPTKKHRVNSRKDDRMNRAKRTLVNNDVDDIGFNPLLEDPFEFAG